MYVDLLNDTHSQTVSAIEALSVQLRVCNTIELSAMATRTTDIRTARCTSGESAQTARSSGQSIKLSSASASYGECSTRSKSRSEILNDADSQPVSANEA